MVTLFLSYCYMLGMLAEGVANNLHFYSSLRQEDHLWIRQLHKTWRSELGPGSVTMPDWDDLRGEESALPPEEGVTGGETSFGFLGGIRV